MKDRFISAQRLSRLLAENSAVVYDVRDERVTDITAQYRDPVAGRQRPHRGSPELCGLVDGAGLAGVAAKTLIVE